MGAVRCCLPHTVLSKSCVAELDRGCILTEPGTHAVLGRDDANNYTDRVFLYGQLGQLNTQGRDCAVEDVLGHDMEGRWKERIRHQAV